MLSVPGLIVPVMFLPSQQHVVAVHRIGAPGADPGAFQGVPFLRQERCPGQGDERQQSNQQPTHGVILV
jgi:hypothetical protein